MRFMGIAMEPQSVDVWIGRFDLGNLFTGKVRWQPTLPELVFAFDFSFGLRSGGKGS